jgi:hypothetical protein
VSLAPNNFRTGCGISYSEPRTFGPIVGADGHAYLLVQREDYVATGCPGSTIVSDQMTWTLWRISPTGALTSVVVEQCQMAACNNLLTPQQLLPDGVGGLLLNVTRPAEARLIRFDADFARADYVLPASGRIDLVGQAGVVYLQTSSGGNWVTQALDVLTWMPMWSATPAWTLVAAAPDGGVAAQASTGELLRIDAAGQLVETMVAAALTDPVQTTGGWVGNGSATLKALAGDFDDATRWGATLAPVGVNLGEPRDFGNPQGKLALRGYFSNYNAIDLITPQSPDTVFNAFVRNFGGLIGNTIVSATVEGDAISGVGQHVTFTLLGLPGLVQPPFSVESLRFDSANRVLSVKTILGHPLFGWRYWRVAQLSPGKIRVETGAVDKPAPALALLYWWSRHDQLRTWQEYLERVRVDLSAQQDFSRPNAAGLVKGVWGYDKFEIIRNVCGTEPVIGTWVCQ